MKNQLSQIQQYAGTNSRLVKLYSEELVYIKNILPSDSQENYVFLHNEKLCVMSVYEDDKVVSNIYTNDQSKINYFIKKELGLQMAREIKSLQVQRFEANVALLKKFFGKAGTKITITIDPGYGATPEVLTRYFTKCKLQKASYDYMANIFSLTKAQAYNPYYTNDNIEIKVDLQNKKTVFLADENKIKILFSDNYMGKVITLSKV